MISRWLDEESRNGHEYDFSIMDITEKDTSDFKEELKHFIAELILTHLADIDELVEDYSDEIPQLLEEHIENYILCTDSHPIGKIVRQGDWGEIISAEILKDINGFTLPIYKLRWKDTKDQSMKGKADVVVCDVSGDNLKIIFTEVKSKIRKPSPKDAIKTCKGACKSLLSINSSEKPEIVNFVYNKLRYQENPDYDLLRLFDRARKRSNSYSRDFQVFFVFDKLVWQEKLLEILNVEKGDLPNLTTNIVLIESMKDLMTQTYSLVPEIAKEVVYR